MTAPKPFLDAVGNDTRLYTDGKQVNGGFLPTPGAEFWIGVFRVTESSPWKTLEDVDWTTPVKSAGYIIDVNDNGRDGGDDDNSIDDDGDDNDNVIDNVVPMNDNDVFRCAKLVLSNLASDFDVIAENCSKKLKFFCQERICDFDQREG